MLLNNDIDLDIPVVLHQGMADEEVPYDSALQLAHRLKSAEVRVILDKQAGHRYSESDQIDALMTTILTLHTKLASELTQDS